jgi:protease-4
MSDVAASGGYYLAMGCDTIVAEKQSLTGSIGVIIAIPNLSGTAGKLGIAVDTVQSNPGALFLSPLLPFAPAQLERLHRLGEQLYRNFLTRVAQRRGLDPDSLRPIAKGRVWSGHAAYRLGLVDTLGGLQTAIALAQRRLGIPSERFPRIKEFPRRKDLLELLLEQFSATERSAAMPELVRLLPPALQRKLEQAVLLWKLSWSEPILALLPPELLP